MKKIDDKDLGSSGKECKEKDENSKDVKDVGRHMLNHGCSRSC